MLNKVIGLQGDLTSIQTKEIKEVEEQKKLKRRDKNTITRKHLYQGSHALKSYLEKEYLLLSLDCNTHENGHYLEW